MVGDDDPDTQEGVEQHGHEERPVSGAPDELVPAMGGDPFGGLLGRVEDEVLDDEVRQREHEQQDARDAHQVPDRGLATAARGPGARLGDG